MFVDPTHLHPRKDRGRVYLEALGVVGILLVLVCIHFYFTTGLCLRKWRALRAPSEHVDELAAGFTHMEKPLAEPISGARGRTRKSKENMGSTRYPKTKEDYAS
jgi:hypothetical protein